MQLPILQRRGQVKPYGSIPRINWGHPLTFGLVTYVYDVGGFCVDLIGGSSGIFATATTVPRAATPFGSGYVYSSTSGAIQTGPPALALFANGTNNASVAPWSLVAGFFVTTNPTGVGCIFGLSDTGGNNIFSFSVATSTTVDFGTSNGIADMNGITVPNFISQYSTLGMTAPTTSSAIGYFNGLNVASQTTSNATTCGAQVPTINTLTQSGLSFNGNYTGSVFYGGAWNRSLSATEMLQMHFDPYSFLVYPEDEVSATLKGAVSAAVTPSQIAGLIGMASCEW